MGGTCSTLGKRRQRRRTLEEQTIPLREIPVEVGPLQEIPVEVVPLREIPVEVWENVIDELQDNRRALLACAEVCRGWTARSRHHLRKWVVLRRPEQVAQLAKFVRTGSWQVESCRAVDIRVDWRNEEVLSWRTLSLFALMFAGKMPRLEELVVWGSTEQKSEWTPGEMHVDVFLHLSTFTLA